jgi:hypothetical protein
MPRASSLIKFDIARFTRDLEPGTPYSRSVKAHSKIAKLTTELKAATVRELRALVKVLSTKEDVYCQFGRILGGEWSVNERELSIVHSDGAGRVWEFNPGELTDRNDDPITS